jgi:hypothetical protein
MIEEERPAMTVWKWYEARVGWMRVVIALAVAAVVLAFIWGPYRRLRTRTRMKMTRRPRMKAPPRVRRSRRSRRGRSGPPVGQTEASKHRPGRSVEHPRFSGRSFLLSRPHGRSSIIRARVTAAARGDAGAAAGMVNAPLQRSTGRREEPRRHPVTMGWSTPHTSASTWMSLRALRASVSAAK